MKKLQFKLEFNEEKMKAIRVCLKEKGKDFDAEMLKFLNKLYDKNVPKSLKSYIEIDMKPEEKTKETKETTENKEPNKEENKNPSYNETLENNNQMR